MLQPTCVIYNPAAGRGKARAMIEAAVARLDGTVELMPTKERRHAIELAADAAKSGFARIIAAGGDGTVFEVANGILQANRPETVFSTMPLGSMNDYAFALGLGRWWADRPTGPPLVVSQADVGVIRGGGRECYFANTVGVGFNGMVTIESQRIRRLRGSPLYITAFLKAGWRHFRTPTLTIAFDEVEVQSPTLALSVNLGQREGGFPITLAARLDDGLFDTLHVTDVRRWELVRYLPAMMTGRLPTNHPKIRTGQHRIVKVRGETPLCLHADGEMVYVPEDDVHEVEIELLPGRLRVETCPTYQHKLT